MAGLATAKLNFCNAQNGLGKTMVKTTRQHPYWFQDGEGLYSSHTRAKV
jgi:hypothetical protein